MSGLSIGEFILLRLRSNPFVRNYGMSFNELRTRPYEQTPSGQYNLEGELQRWDNGYSGGLTSVVLKNTVKALTGKELDLGHLSSTDYLCIKAIAAHFQDNQMTLIPEHEKEGVESAISDIEDIGEGEMDAGSYDILLSELEGSSPQSFSMVQAAMSLQPKDMSIEDRGDKLKEMLLSLLRGNFLEE